MTTVQMPAHLKLTYFDFTGLAEAIRLTFAVGNVKFEDVRLTGEDFAAQKAAGKFPMGSVPVLEVDGKVVCQSDAILNYAAKLAGIYSADAFTAMKVDEVLGAAMDIQQTLFSTYAIQDRNEKIAKRKIIAAGVMASRIESLNKILENNGTKYAVSDEITSADIRLYAMVKSLTSGFFEGLPADVFESYAKIQACVKAVAEHPMVVQWYADQGTPASEVN